jgi:putative NADH-flavin reductase
MQLLVFGATGGTGRELVEQALAQGHEVTAYVRNPAKLGAIMHARLQVIRGDVLDAAAVEQAVPGHDAVVCAIGAGAGRTSLRDDGTRNIVRAMQKTGVRRLICQSSMGIGDSRANLGFLTKYVIVPLFLRHAFADHERQEAVVKESDLDWTIVRPPYLKDGPRTEAYRHGFPSTDTGIQGKISRADVADFMLKQLATDTYLHLTPGVSY